MKVEIKSKSTISESLHTDRNSLAKMISTTNQNIKSPIKINKEDDVKKLFNRSISKTLKERQHHLD